MNLPSFVTVENVVTVGGLILGLLGFDKYKTKAASTAKGVLALANALAAAYRAIPDSVKPRLQDLLLKQVPGLKGARAKQVLSLAEKLVIQANLRAMADAAEAVEHVFEKLPPLPKLKKK